MAKNILLLNLGAISTQDSVITTFAMIIGAIWWYEDKL